PNAPRGFVAETLHRGPLYSAETITCDGRTWLLGVSNRVVSDEPYFREEAISFPVRFGSRWEREVSEWIQEIFTAIGVEDGVCHTEFIATAGGFEVVEINPRLGGLLVGQSIHRAYGRNVYRSILELAMGRRPGGLGQERELLRGYAHAIRYAHTTGTIAEITMDLAGFPGNVRWHA
ncbi:ATP-grasp domain-containing protein, partial [Nocardia gipuzkoensis]